MKYSIITINYNNRDGLRRTIESVVCQTFRDFEYIIIDGGSTDGSVDVIKEYAEHIDYWVSEPDKGIYNAMNKGILKAHGEYLNFMNSGDCFYDREVLEKMQGVCEKDLLIGRVADVDEKCHIISYNMPAKQMTMFHFFLSSLPHQGCFIKSSLFKEVGLYDERLKIVSDWKFFMDSVVGKNCSFIHTNILVAACECRGASNDYTQLHDEKEKVLSEVLLPGIYEDYKHLSTLGVDAYDKIIYISKYQRLRIFLSRLLTVIIFIHKKVHSIKNSFKTFWA